MIFFTRRRPASGLAIVPMRRHHVPAVIAIENVVFSQPWTESLYLSELATRERLYLVALDDGKVVGYIGEMLVVDEAHVTTLAVCDSHRRRGIAKALLYHGLRGAIESGIHAATLEVRVSNRGAQSLYHQFGFVPAGIRKDYYTQATEDGLVMWSYDIDSPAFAERLAAIGDEIAALGLPLPPKEARR